jgi:hypothetical protein
MEATRSRFDARSRLPAEGQDHAKAEADDGTRPMITNQTVISRRAAIGGGLAGLAGLGGLLLFPGQVLAKDDGRDDSFVLLLKGLYHPVVHGPNLGLSTVDLNDGSYSTTKIYPISGIRGSATIDKAVGDFYVQFAGDLCAYHVPGGSFSMRFTGGSFTDLIPDGLGGQFMDGTFDLTVLEATGKFRRFVGGHNFMVDRLHALASGDFDEYCLCLVTRLDREHGRGTTKPLDRAMRRA